MVAGYNVQIAVDDRHKLIVASEVVNDGNDSGQLHAMAVAAKEALGVETLQAVADVGYYNGETLRACETDAIVAYVPEANRTSVVVAQGRFSVEGLRLRRGRRRLPLPGRSGAAARWRVTSWMRPASCSFAMPAAARSAEFVRCAQQCLTDKGSATRRLSMGASRCDRSASCADGPRRGERDDAPPRCSGRASLRHPQMPSRIPPLPAARLRTRYAANGA